MAQQGEAAGYYTGAPQEPQQAYYQGQQYGQQQPMNYSQQPPQYGNNDVPPQGPPPTKQTQQQNSYTQMEHGEKPSFDQAFKVEKPKYNDLWAGLLFIAVFLGYVAVSGISIRGYGRLKPSQVFAQLLTACSAKHRLQRRHSRRPQRLWTRLQHCHPFRVRARHGHDSVIRIHVGREKPQLNSHY